MKIIIFHGSYSKNTDCWFPYLKHNLQLKGHEIFIPQFPVANWEETTKNGAAIVENVQNLHNWMAAFDTFYNSQISKEDELCLVGHSLGTLFILHVLATYHINLHSAFFVAPFYERLDTMWQIDAANKTFYKTDFSFHTLKMNTPKSYVFYSNNDPYVNHIHSLNFAEKLGCDKIFIPGGKHMSDERYLTFPILLNTINTTLL